MKLLKLAAAAALFGMAGVCQASMIITNGNVSLGVDDYGQLNVPGGNADVTGLTGVGLRYLSDGLEYESTYHGCLCEGWGVAATNISGFANNNFGAPSNLSLVSFDSTASTATSVTTMGGLLQITHDFALAAETDDLFRVSVTIENISGADIAELLYRRTFDWDTSPTPFEEFVTIGGTAAASSVFAANDNGFCSSDPLDSCSQLLASGDFTASGPEDHGANFDFNFGALLTGETFSFDIFYGGAANRNAALSALASVEAEVYSFGWSALDVDQDGFGDDEGEITPTYIFGFSGVGGTVIIDPDDPVAVPAPASMLLFAGGLVALFARRKRYAKL
ncbi:PEP-CTERM sorting domain-containing protein [Arsukibacterium sp.]|uniref:PEP-CTERM sorting domain-containing protein n=1 Tax=Arsukibacterium sp. TaxID=1977258 RepID=UPI00299DE2AC|nr:PEP-CTERM sorting domain-containing protein [Arsukibacterium sp.]MDX1537687.1 PEP-CTERM sorting domain-containing protein [Arsukibacterium sp.]